MYALWVSVKIKPEMRERFLAAIEDDSICSVRDEPACVRFDVLQDRQDSDRYYFYEVYHDEAGFKAHTETPHLKRWREAAAECVVEQSAVRCDTVFPRQYA